MTTKSPTRHIERPDGRRVAMYDLTPGAPADAPVVLLCHIAPGSGAFDPDPAATAARGVRLVSLDRPGYGGSDPMPESEFATVEVAIEDAAAVLREVLPAGAKAGVAGWSAGGRIALGLAARYPELVGRVAVIGTPAPDEHVQWIPAENKAGLDALRDASAAEAHAALAGAFGPMLEATQGDARFALLGLADADAAVLATEGTVDRVRDLVDTMLAQGGVGMIADVAGYSLRPWGFDPADVTADVLLGYATEDFVGPAHGEWYQKTLPSARLELVADTGHLLVVPFWDRALAHLT
ncbi:alpha/beta fold hydrolase [Pseudonocardia sp. TRM90224]|uniref:alpha/beta fold hydrolase n=1 Tax=Pseudonocardia sp. TRM90224 TaxID=2812678 RepID=UPI001E50E388|nr:alpha/beta fold hydrolase [Pseudonocardia sp. TRM90224]